tara:strand:+ start:4174 stop:4362 length:189 start_codon:yes stop_codon:yes gene_type:complete
MRSSNNNTKEKERERTADALQKYLDNGGTIKQIDSGQYQRERGRLSKADMSRREYLLQMQKK